MIRMRRWTLAAAAAVVAMWVAAGSVLAADGAVTIACFAFDPASVTVQVGDSVTWTNQDSTAHTATAAGAFDTGNIASGASATVTFDTAGTFAYACSIHPTMTATVVVQAASAPEPTVGGGVSITPAPTDTLAAIAAEEGASLAVALALAILGLVMLVGTLVADRRFRAALDEK
jgi:plastocyanin